MRSRRAKEDESRSPDHFQAGQRLALIVIAEPNADFDDFTVAAGTSLDFWDNPLDDEDWNAASSG